MFGLLFFFMVVPSLQILSKLKRRIKAGGGYVKHPQESNDKQDFEFNLVKSRKFKAS